MNRRLATQATFAENESVKKLPHVVSPAPPSELVRGSRSGQNNQRAVFNKPSFNLKFDFDLELRGMA